MLEDCSVVELRQYTLHGGTREQLIHLFENKFIESQEALGIRVIGPFSDLEDPNRFVWFRGFPDMNERGRMLSAFYEGPVWRVHRDEAKRNNDRLGQCLIAAPHSRWVGQPGSGERI